ncbi:MAG: hypothetical protein PVJ19_16615 [Desulfobacteraceae bacterium]|jgi:hypothetical protein
MKVNMKCFAKLVNVGSCNFHDSTLYELKDGQTVEDLIEAAGLKKDGYELSLSLI